jgi:hypothetical protein
MMWSFKKDLDFRLVEMAEVLMFLQLGDFSKCFAAQGEPAGEQPKNNLKWKSLLTSNSGAKAVRSYDIFYLLKKTDLSI